MGQSWQTLLVGRQGQAASGFGSVCRWALVVQRAAKARIFTFKIKEYATSDHHQTVTCPDRDARDKKTESTRPAVLYQTVA